MNALGFAPSLISNSAEPLRWLYVTRRFKALQANLALQAAAVEDANTKARGVIKSLNRYFRDESILNYYVLAGSLGKNTAIHPPTDIDLCFILPIEVYHRFSAYSGNKGCVPGGGVGGGRARSHWRSAARGRRCRWRSPSIFGEGSGCEAWNLKRR